MNNNNLLNYLIAFVFGYFANQIMMNMCSRLVEGFAGDVEDAGDAGPSPKCVLSKAAKNKIKSGKEWGGTEIWENKCAETSIDKANYYSVGGPLQRGFINDEISCTYSYWDSTELGNSDLDKSNANSMCEYTGATSSPIGTTPPASPNSNWCSNWIAIGGGDNGSICSAIGDPKTNHQ